MKPTCPKIGLALGSGGARGMAHIGVLKRLRAWGLPIHCVAGTSIGAIVGAAYASGAIVPAEAFVETLDWKKTAKLFLEVNIPRSGILTGKNIIRLFKQLIPCTTIESMPIRFASVATNIFTGQEVVLNHGDVFEAIRASMAIPGVFTPVLHDGAQLVDGGLVNPLPVSVCRAMGADLVIGVDINLIRDTTRVPRVNENQTPSIFDILTHAFRIVENEVTRRTIATDPPDILIQPAVGDIQTLEFKHTARAIAAGIVAADACQGQLVPFLSK